MQAVVGLRHRQKIRGQRQRRGDVQRRIPLLASRIRDDDRYCKSPSGRVGMRRIRNETRPSVTERP